MIRRLVEPFPQHDHIDNTCALDSERIPYGGWELTEDLKDDMSDHPISYLASRYPEYTFGFRSGAGRPNGHLIAKQCKGGWRFADWRTT